MSDERPVIDLGGVVVRVRTTDARTGEILRANFRPWRATKGAKGSCHEDHEAHDGIPPRRARRTRDDPGHEGGLDDAGPVELDLVRVSRLPAGGRPRTGATWTRTAGRHRIVSRWFRLTFDAAAGRAEATVSARFGMADFCRPLAGALLASRGGFLLHTAALEAPGGGALLFCGPSGYGKTTLAKSVPRRVVLADDSVGIQFVPGSRFPVPGSRDADGAEPAGQPGTRNAEPGTAVLAHPTPFFGDYGRPPAGLRPGGRPVRALFLLERPSRKTTAHAATPATPGEAAARVLTQILMANEAPPDIRARLLDRAVALATAVPVFWFRYVPGPSVWDYVRGLRIGRGG